MDCRRCGEDAILVSFGGKHIVRVRRRSKCKNYERRGGDMSCKTSIYDDPKKAIEDWNGLHKTDAP